MELYLSPKEIERLRNCIKLHSVMLGQRIDAGVSDSMKFDLVQSQESDATLLRKIEEYFQ